MAVYAIEDGWVAGIRRRPSPNHDARPEGVAPDTLVVHGITLPPGHFGGDWIDALFTNSIDASAPPALASIADLRVSAHMLIARTGQVTQYVDFQRRAWHAGPSVYDGRDDVNDFSIGIELEGTDECPYTPIQYRELARIAGALIATYPGLSAARIVGHCDIAPSRKTDPGSAFDWALFRRHLARLR